MNLQKPKSVRNSKFVHSGLIRFFPALVLLLLVLPAYAKYGGGSGTLADPYRIATPEQLNDIGNHEEDWDKHFILVNDIDLSAYTGTQFNMIGDSWEVPNSKPFTGVFDGNGHRIRNFTWRSDNMNAIGLFRCVWLGAHIINLGMENVNIDAGHSLGVGAITGANNGGTISACYTTGRISGQTAVGGLAGCGQGIIMNCYSTVNILCIWQWESCGGLVGGFEGTIINSYSTGKVSDAGFRLGGLSGGSKGVVNSFWDIETSGQSVSGGGKGRTTSEMKKASTFFGWGGCGHEQVWTIDEGKDYPRLAWEGKSGQPIPKQQLTDLVPGRGTESDPYLISTPEQLNAIGLFPCEWDKHFRLMADIDLSAYKGTEFNMIGVGTKFLDCYGISSVYYGFNGVFDGNNHKIWNFTWDNRGQQHAIGLFGEVGGFGVIENVCLENVNVTCPDDACYLGALVGWNFGAVTHCYASGKVVGTAQVGGLIGVEQGLMIDACYTEGTVVCGRGDGTVGGLVGVNGGRMIENCYSIANVSGDGAGGLVGHNAGLLLTNCYSAGAVTGQDRIGGLIGSCDEGRIATGSFWDVEASGQTRSAGGQGKTTAEMKTRSTFADAGWDFVGETPNGIEDIWFISEGIDYPRLSYFYPCAYAPSPPDGATFVDPNVTLTWMPSPTAESHDVYFGDNSADVNDGTGGTFQGSQTETYFVVGLSGTPYPDGLVPDTTYYWRIDEHNADGTVARGQVWSFTVKLVKPVEETMEYQVTSSEDDGYAFNNNFQSLDTDRLTVGATAFAKPPYYMCGMVFRNVEIPQGAQIVSAYLKIQAYNSRLSDVVYGTIQAEATDNAADFGAFRNISTLTKTNDSVEWDLEEPWSADTWYTSPDIAAVIQEVVDRSGWSADNSLAVIYSTRLREGGYRNISSFDRGSDYAPILEITYIP